MERPNTVAGLIEKRREIAGQIEHHQRALNELIIDLDHVDHTIRLFDPDCDVTLAQPKNPLSLTSLTETSNVGGAVSTRSYDAATRTWAVTTPVKSAPIFLSWASGSSRRPIAMTGYTP